VQFVEWLNRNKKPLHPKPIAFTAIKDDVDVDIALQYEDGYNENTFTFVNNINTHEGGTHLTGFQGGAHSDINDVAKKREFLKKEDFTCRGGIRRADLRAAREGQGAAVRGADQDQARQLRGRGIVKTVINEHLGNYLDEHHRLRGTSSRRPSAPHEPASAARRGI